MLLFALDPGDALSAGVARELGLAPAPFEERRFVLALPPLSLDTGAVYRAWDARRGARRGAADDDGGNDLEAPAIDVEPQLAAWRDAFGARTGRRPRLAGSGSAWFVEGEPDALGLDGCDAIVVAGERAPLLAVRTVPAGPVPGDSVRRESGPAASGSP